MRIFSSATIAMLVAVPAFAADYRADVTKAYDAWDAAFNKKDAKALSGAYATEAYVLPPTHDVLRGQTAIEKLFSGFFENGVTAHKLELIDAGGDGKVVYGAAKWSAKAKDKDLGGIVTHIFERQPDGTLKLVVHTFN